MIDFNTFQQIIGNLSGRINEVEVRESHTATAWHFFQPNVTQNVTLSTPGHLCEWMKLDKLVVVKATMMLGTNGSPGTEIRFTLSSEIPSVDRVYGIDARGGFAYLGPGRSFYAGAAVASTDRTFLFVRDGSPVYFGAGDVNVLIGDYFSFTLAYKTP